MNAICHYRDYQFVDLIVIVILVIRLDIVPFYLDFKWLVYHIVLYLGDDSTAVAAASVIANISTRSRSFKLLMVLLPWAYCRLSCDSSTNLIHANHVSYVQILSPLIASIERNLQSILNRAILR